jgi:hypothetical protein
LARRKFADHRFHPDGGNTMADAQRQHRAASSVVGSCSATECRHNEDRECHAGEILVQIGGNGTAVCDTYSPESPQARP